MRRASDTESTAEAEKAKIGLCQGIEKSKALLAQYRTRLSFLRRADPARAPDRSIFRFDG